MQVLRLGRRGKTICAFERFAEISAHTCSRPLQRRIVDFYAERSGEKTIATLQEHYGISLSLHAVQSVSKKASIKAKELNSQPPAKATTWSQTLIAQLDGSMVPIIEFGDAGDRRKQRHTCWKEFRLCTVSEPGRDFTRYGVARGGPLEVGCMMYETCRHEGMNEESHIHGVADGATWIAEQYEQQFGIRHRFLLDFYHACEYLSAAREGGSEREPMPGDWYEKQKEALLEGRTCEVFQELEKRVGNSESEKDNPALICLRYLQKRSDQLDYPTARAAKLPIGSGEVESGHRHILQQRLKIPGAWWLEETANEMSHLRVLRANERWHELWHTEAA